MNPLDAIKQKLMVKPKLQERERVEVVIQGVKPKILLRKKREPEQEEGEQGEQGEGEGEGEELEEGSEQIQERIKEKKRTLIIDKTNQPFDREAFLKKMTDSNLKKVIRRPVLEEREREREQEKEREIVAPAIKKPKKIVKKLLVIEEEPELEQEKEREKEQEKEEQKEEQEQEKEKEQEQKEEQQLVLQETKPKKRKTKVLEKGVAVLGPEVVVNIGDTDLRRRLPKRSVPIRIKASSYYMNDREKFVNFINSLFEPYRLEMERNKESISCDDIGNTSSDFSLLTHQEIVRDYLNLYTPYRGLLLYHGLGSGKTCTSIAIAEGMKFAKKVIIMTPASLRPNYIEELKKCGDLLYKRNQFWEWISIETNPDAVEPMSAILNLPQEYIRKQRGAWFINIKKKTNYDKLNDTDKRLLEDQLNEMIKQKYQFINYNGLRTKRLEELTSGFTKNLFDDAVIIIDEAHNLISRIVNKLKKEKPVSENERGVKERLPVNLATKLYEYLMSANNARVILLTGTPIINYPNEFGILFNILRGYIRTWKIPLDVKTSKKIDRNSLYEMLMGEKSLDYLDYSPASKVLTITRNPFGFKNKTKMESGYQGVSNTVKDKSGNSTFETEFPSDDDFERKIISILRRNDIEVVASGIRVQNFKALPDTFELFESQYIDSSTKQIKNMDALKRRILGLSSYFRSAQENLLPTYSKTPGKDYHIIRIPMSDFQFKIYETERQKERKLEKQRRKPKLSDDYEPSSTYRIFSRLFCNFVMTDRPRPKLEVSADDKEALEELEEEDDEDREEKMEAKEPVVTGKKDKKEQEMREKKDKKEQEAKEKKEAKEKEAREKKEKKEQDEREKKEKKEQDEREKKEKKEQEAREKKEKKEQEEREKKEKKEAKTKKTTTRKLKPVLVLEGQEENQGQEEKEGQEEKQEQVPKLKNPKTKKTVTKKIRPLLIIEPEQEETKEPEPQQEEVEDLEDVGKDLEKELERDQGHGVSEHRKGGGPKKVAFTAAEKETILLTKKARKEEFRRDVEDDQIGEVEADQVLEDLGGVDYKERLEAKIREIRSHSNEFLTPEALQTYSPKFLHMLENIEDPEHRGLHLVYSQFRTIEGIGIFSLVLEKNGFAQFRLKKSTTGNWEIDIDPEDQGKPTFALYTGTETSEEKEIVRHIYNGEWDQVPESISIKLRKMARNNNMGEIIKVFMITSSGSEGINLRNTRYVHIMEPYWHPVRTEQVIGRARRICSHKSLPKELQTVEVFIYLMIFSPEQLKSDQAVELKRNDLSKSIPKVPITSDQYLFEISEIKANLTAQLTDAIKESSFDCYLYSNGKCVNFGDPTNNKFSYTPDYTEQQNDTTARANKVAIEWTGVPIRILGVEYVSRAMSKNNAGQTFYIYDKKSYEAALENPAIIPLHVGTLEIAADGTQRFLPI